MYFKVFQMIIFQEGLSFILWCKYFCNVNQMNIYWKKFKVTTNQQKVVYFVSLYFLWMFFESQKMRNYSLTDAAKQIKMPDLSIDAEVKINFLMRSKKVKKNDQNKISCLTSGVESFYSKYPLNEISNTNVIVLDVKSKNRIWQ